MGVAVSEQHRRWEPHPDEMGDLGVHRRGEPGRERRDHFVGLVTASLDRQRPARLDVDQDVTHRPLVTPSCTSATHGMPTWRASSLDSSTGTSAASHQS